MGQDYLMRQFDQLGMVLAKMVRRMLHLKEQGLETLILTEIEQELPLSLGIEGRELLTLNESEFQVQVLENREWTAYGLEQLLVLFQFYADDCPQPERKISLFNKMLAIHTFLETKERTYSLEREAQKSALHKAIDTLEGKR